MTEKLSVVVVGLLPGQARELARRCPGVRLRFASGKGSAPRFPGGDAVVLVRFITHKWSGAAFRRWPRHRVHYHPGGLSGLVGLVNGLAAGGEV